MRYLNGRLHAEQDSTQLLKRYPEGQKLTSAEYVPIALLCALLLGLVLAHLFG